MPDLTPNGGATVKMKLPQGLYDRLLRCAALMRQTPEEFVADAIQDSLTECEDAADFVGFCDAEVGLSCAVQIGGRYYLGTVAECNGPRVTAFLPVNGKGPLPIEEGREIRVMRDVPPDTLLLVPPSFGSLDHARKALAPHRVRASVSPSASRPEATAPETSNDPSDCGDPSRTSSTSRAVRTDGNEA